MIHLILDELQQPMLSAIYMPWEARPWWQLQCWVGLLKNCLLKQQEKFLKEEEPFAMKQAFHSPGGILLIPMIPYLDWLLRELCQCKTSNKTTRQKLVIIYF